MPVWDEDFMRGHKSGIQLVALMGWAIATFLVVVVGILLIISIRTQTNQLSGHHLNLIEEHDETQEMLREIIDRSWGGSVCIPSLNTD